MRPGGGEFRRRRRCCCLAVVVCTGASAFGWTDPITLSDQVNDVQWPRLCRSASGGVHLIYRFRFRPWKVAYRFRDPAGNFSPIEYPGLFVFQDTPWPIEDAQGKLHIFYAGGPDGNWPEHWTQIYAVSRQGGNWSNVQVTSTEDKHHGYPRAARDPAGQIHLVYLKTNLNSTTSSGVYHRSFNGVTWSTDTYLGQANNFYYHHCGITADAMGRVHVVWVATGGSRLQLMYRRLQNGTWSAAKAIGGSLDQSWLTFPVIAALGQSRLVAAASDDINGTPTIKATVSHDGGDTWSTYAPLFSGS